MRKIFLTMLWPWTSSYDLEKLFSNAHSHGTYLCHVSLNSLH